MDEAKIKELVEKFQCPGCVAGMDIECGSFKLADDINDGACQCVGHVLGTHMGLGNPVALGLPKGFHKPGWYRNGEDPNGGWKHRNQMEIRLWETGTAPEWNNLNVPVWAMEQEGYLFVRTYAPRINGSWVDVIEGGTMDLVEAAHSLNMIDVGQFYDEID